VLSIRRSFLACGPSPRAFRLTFASRPLKPSLSLSLPLSLFGIWRALAEFRAFGSDARAIRCSRRQSRGNRRRYETGEEKIKEGRSRKKKKKREREREKGNREGAEERIEKSSASVGSHISFEVRKPTSGVLTSPSGTTFRKIILLGAKPISIDSPRSLRRGCGEGGSRGRRVEARAKKGDDGEREKRERERERGAELR